MVQQLPSLAACVSVEMWAGPVTRLRLTCVLLTAFCACCLGLTFLSNFLCLRNLLGSVPRAESMAFPLILHGGRNTAQLLSRHLFPLLLTLGGLAVPCSSVPEWRQADVSALKLLKVPSCEAQTGAQGTSWPHLRGSQCEEQPPLQPPVSVDPPGVSVPALGATLHCLGLHTCPVRFLKAPDMVLGTRK